MRRCYNEECDYELEDLGNDAWPTGCPLCGTDCWNRSQKQIDRVNKQLDTKEVE